MVDVNIHPSKREVKFRQERMVRQLVAQAVRETLLVFHTAKPSAGIPQKKELAPPEKTCSPEPEPPKPVEFPQFTAFTGTPLDLKPKSEVTPTPQPVAPAVTSPARHVTQAARPIMVEQPPPGAAMTAVVPLLAVPLRLLGVIGRLYVILESDRGLVLMDQHAAHERILFEQMLSRLEKGNAASQRLLLP